MLYLMILDVGLLRSNMLKKWMSSKLKILRWKNRNIKKMIGVQMRRVT